MLMALSVITVFFQSNTTMSGVWSGGLGGYIPSPPSPPLRFPFLPPLSSSLLSLSLEVGPVKSS